MGHEGKVNSSEADGHRETRREPRDAGTEQEAAHGDPRGVRETQGGGRTRPRGTARDPERDGGGGNANGPELETQTKTWRGGDSGSRPGQSTESQHGFPDGDPRTERKAEPGGTGRGGGPAAAALQLHPGPALAPGAPYLWAVASPRPAAT